jgi:hypothetical protein
MSIPIPLRRDFGAPRLRILAKKTKDGPQTRRLLTLAAIYDGATRTEAAKIGGVGLQIIRDWVLRFASETLQLDRHLFRQRQIAGVKALPLSIRNSLTLKAENIVD